jgi:hypothetical protein
VGVERKERVNESEVLKVSRIKQIKGSLLVAALLIVSTACLAVGPMNDGIYTIRSSVMASAGGRVSEAPSGAFYTMNFTVGQPSAVGISAESPAPFWKVYAGYQLPLILSNVDSLVTYHAMPDMKLWWEKVPWATGYQIYGNGVDPYTGLYTLLGATTQRQYTHSGIAGTSAQYFYRVTALRPWVSP